MIDDRNSINARKFKAKERGTKQIFALTFFLRAPSFTKRL